jgi:hypothetical protein
MAHLLTNEGPATRALVLQDRAITNTRRDAGTGADIEQERQAEDAKNYFQDVPFDDDTVEAIQAISGRRVRILPPAGLVQPDQAMNGLARLFELVEYRALQRLPPGSLFPPDSVDLNGGNPEDIFPVCAKKPDGELEKPEVIAFKLLLLCAGMVLEQDCLPSGQDEHLADMDELRDHLGLDTNDDVLPYLAALGVSLIILAVAKPFVTKVTAAVRTMCANMASDLKIKPSHLSQEVFAFMFKSYISKVDLRAIARFTINRKFNGWQWGCAYAARFGAGTSHLTAISTFIARFPDFPLWHLIPQIEIDSFFEAIDKVNNDPLYLFPVVGQPEMEKDKYRVSAMPTMVATSIFILASAGDKNWSRYENVPFLTSVGSLTPSSFLNVLRQWAKAKLLPTSPELLMEDYKTFSDIDGWRDDLPISMFVQPAGKNKSFLQRP